MPFALPDLPFTIRSLTDQQAQRLQKRYPRMNFTPENCLTCAGAKAFRWYAPGSRTEVADWTCNCMAQYRLHRALMHSNIGLTYQRLAWEDMTEAEPEAVRFVQGYLARQQAYTRAGIGLIMYGTKGAGKTALSTLAVKALLWAGHDVYFTTFSEMIDTYTGGWNDTEEKSWFHRRIKNAGVLVMDDVGKEYQGRTKGGLPEATFDEVLRHRVAGSAPTIVTSNLDLQGLKDGYGAGIMSLLSECSITYRFTGEDARLVTRNRLMDEVEAGLTRPVIAE